MHTILQPKRVGAILLTLALLFAAVPVSAHQPQEFDPGLYVSELTGFEIEATGPNFEITNAELQHYSTGNGEVMLLQSAIGASTLEISFYDDSDSPQESIDIYLQSMEAASEEMEIMDVGFTGEVHYAVVNLVYDGLDIVYYMQIEEDVQGNVDLFQSSLSAPDLLESDLADAQDEVTIDGTPFLDNVDAAELADVFAGEGTLGGASDTASPVPTTDDPTTDSHTFAESGVEVSIGPDFSFAGVPEQGMDVEAVRITGPDTRSMLAVGETGTSPEVVLNSFASGIESGYGSTENLDEEIGDDYAWRLIAISPEARDSSFMLIWVDTSSASGYEVMHAHELSPGNVAGGLDLIQEQVLLDGQPLMTAIDFEEIAVIADEHSSAGDSTPVIEAPVGTEEVGDDSADSQSGDPRDNARLPEGGDEDAVEGNTSETGGGESTGLTPGEGDGLPGEFTDSSWQGGVHGHLIEWDAATWYVDIGYEGDLVSDPVAEEDTIVLQPTAGDNASFLYVSVLGPDDRSPQEFLDHWTSDTYLEVFRSTGAEIELLETRTRGDSTAVLFEMTTPGGAEYRTVQQAVTLESGEVLVVFLDAPPSELVDTYESAQAVTINGEPVFDVFSPSQLERFDID